QARTDGDLQHVSPRLRACASRDHSRTPARPTIAARVPSSRPSHAIAFRGFDEPLEAEVTAEEPFLVLEDEPCHRTLRLHLDPADRIDPPSRRLLPLPGVGPGADPQEGDLLRHPLEPTPPEWDRL